MTNHADLIAALRAAHDAEVYRRGQEDMRERAARVPDLRASEYDREFGSYDGSTGVTEYPGNGCEWMEEWETITAEIRALPIKEKDDE